MITAQELATALRAQAAASGTIRIDDALLGISGWDALVTRDLLRHDGVLLLEATQSLIPQAPPAAGFSIPGAGVPEGADGFLNLDKRWASITFAFGSTIDVTLTVQPDQFAGGQAAPWAPSTSFPELEYQGYDQLALAKTQLVLATTDQQGGLSLQSTLTPSGVLASAEQLLGLTTTFPLAGEIERADNGDLSLQLDADLGIKTFGIAGIVELQQPRIAIVYARTTAKDATIQIFVNIALVATISAGSTNETGAGTGKVELDVSIGMPLATPDSPLLQLAVLPKDFSASLSSLGSLVAGQTWDDFFTGPGAELKPYFDTFGFIGYTMTFTTSAKVSSLTLRVGTLKPWTLWNNYTLSLDATWSVTFLNPGTVQTLVLHAGFDFDGKMQFDVDVYLPALRITGVQSGAPLQLTLADVDKKLFDGNLSIPDDLLTVSVGSFWIDIDKPNKKLGIGAIASASVSLFGTQLLSVADMAIAVTIDDSGPKKIYSATLDGRISLGPITAQVDAVLSNDPATGCTFTVHLVNETVGSLLGHLVHLVDPTYDVSFGAPWDKLLDISLDALVLKVDITNKKVEIDYVAEIDLGFLKITQLGLSWQKNAGGPSTTKITIAGSLLGVSFGGDSGNPPLAWDPINENPPAVPGGGDKLLDLRYVGIGQHVGFDPSWQPANVEAVITKMEALALPAGGSNIPNLTTADGLRFRSDSGWLVGADFTVLGTVQLAFVFNDPSLYGLLIALSGTRAKSFAGLKFEILYHKVTDTIGVYHIELTLPDVMRHLEFGEVSITLPQIVLDIYTNGNFRIDFGFPKGLDFSNSFCLQIFPFIGYGGFYFALLNGDTSTRVPKITNGRFDPVIEFGIALSVGVGKTIDEGILSGGLSVVVIGIVEGVIGWFNPSDAGVEKAEYYWLQGTISIVGRLYGTINFYIIQASLSVTAYASVTLVIEAHQPILISMSVGVSVEVSIKIVFFTIHCSFSATVSASFTIGSASPTPWIVAGGNAAPRFQLFAHRDGVHAPQQRMFAAFPRFVRRERMQQRLEAGDLTLTWNVQTVFSSPRAVTLHAMPAFTQAGGGVAAILLLGIADGIPARAATLRDHVAAGDGAPDAGIGDVLEGLVRWAVLNARATLGESDGTLVSHDDVALLARAFADGATLADALDYDAFLSAFLGANYRFTIATPAAGAGGDDTGVAVFPMPPALTMTAGSNPAIDFAVYNGLDATTLAKLQAYFQLLAVDYEKFVAQSGDAPTAQAEADGALTPVAQAVFEQYFAMLMRAAVKAAGDVMESYPFAYDDATQPFGIADVRTALGDPGLPAIDVVSPNRANDAILAQGAVIALEGVQHQVALGDSFASVAAAFNALLPAGAQITATQVAQDNVNAGALLQPGASVTFANLEWTTLAGESIDLVVARLLTRAATQAFLQQFTGLQTLAQGLLAANPAVFPPPFDQAAALRMPIDPVKFPQLTLTTGATYSTAPGDTFTSIAASLLALTGTYVDIPSAAAWVLANNSLPVTDPALPQPTGTAMTLPPVVHVLQTGESIADLAVLLLTNVSAVITGLLAVPPQTALLAAQAMLALPPLQYAIRSNDSFASIAATFNLSLDGLADALDASPAAVFAAGAQLVVSDAEQMTVDRLVAALAATQWKTVAPMASRFMLSGLRLPNPADPTFAALTLAEMSDPTKLGAITTMPLYALTGQQFAIANPPAAGYTIALAPDTGTPWIAGSIAYELDQAQIDVIAEIAGATFAPAVELDALPLFRLAPARYTMQQHVAWQPARLPSGAVYSPAAAGGVTGNPDLWMFPDALVARLAADGTNQPPYTVSIGTHENAQAGMSVSGARAFAWATAVRVAIAQLPSDESATATAATIAAVTGVDDAGLALLDALLAHFAQNPGEDATLFLLYPPNPASTAAGLYSDDLGAPTALVQTNLSTLSHSGALLPAARRSAFLVDADSGNPTYVAPLTSAAAFLQLLWECSIVRSGGYYLRYAPANGGALPPALFTNGPTAELTLLVVLESQNAAHASILPFNTCAIVGDNIDPSKSNVFVQSATWLVAQPSSLADAAAYASQTFGLTLDAAAVASLNADVPQLLRPGAVVAVPNAPGTDTVRIDDTLTSLAARNGLQPATLAAFGTNATAQILTPTGLVQFAPGALAKTAAFDAGNAGFQLTRPNPDPGNTLQATAMDGDTLLAELYHMLAQRIVPNASGSPDFLRSGEAVPVSPAQSVPTENGGNVPPDVANDRWDYHQAVAVAPFALGAYGSASPALPPAAANPYAGVGPDAAVTLDFMFADPYGNELPLPAGAAALVQPVRYFDELIGVRRWPSAAAGYTLSGDGTSDPSLVVELTMQLDKYAVSPALSANRAARNAATDRATYVRAYYQLSQPDVGFALTTTLEPASGGVPVSHALDPVPFRSFVIAAWLALDALCATSAAVFDATGTESIGSVAASYGVALADVFAANGSALYSSLFGETALNVPQLYTTVPGDTLAAIAKAQSIDPVVLAQQNPWAALETANDLSVPARSFEPTAQDSLASIAATNQSSVSGLATANPSAALADDLAIAVAGIEIQTQGDTFPSLVAKFGARGIAVTAGEIAIANQTIPGIFVTPVTLAIEDLVPKTGDSLGALQQRFGFTLETLATDNASLPNLFAAGTPLYIGPGTPAPVPAAGTTLAQFAAGERVPLAALGLALWNGLQPATPAAVNAGAVLTAKATLTIPATIVNPGTGYAPYRAQSLDTDIAAIAAKFAGNDPGLLGTLSVDLPGLFVPGTPVVDAASGTSIPATAQSTFASLVAAFAAQGHTVTAQSLATDNATTTNLVQSRALWIAPPMLALAQAGGTPDTLARIAARYGSDVVTVASSNAGVLGFLAPGVALPSFGGIAHTTGANDTLNALLAIYTPPGGKAPSLAALATAFADVALIAPGTPVLPLPIPSSMAVTIAPAFAEPIVELGVTLTESRTAGWVADGFATVTDVAATYFEIPAQAVAGSSTSSDPNALSLDAFATSVETALPGVRVATGEGANENDDTSRRTLWVVNFTNPRGPGIAYTFEDATTLRSFAIPPLSTSLASGTVPVTPYVSGTGLSGDPLPVVFAGTDLDVWGATFLSAMDLVLSPVYAVPAQEGSLTDFDTIVEAKRTLATSIAGRVQYILDGGGPGEYGATDPRRDAAIAAMQEALLVALGSAYSIESVVQAAVDVVSPYADAVTAPRLSGRATLTQPGAKTPVKNASLSTAKVPVAAASAADPALASFLLTVQAPATDRSIEAQITYDVTEIERPSGPPDPNGYQTSTWLTLVHPLSKDAVPDVTLPIPLRAYPLPPSLLSQVATASYADPATPAELVRWDASAVWAHQDADQDETALQLRVGNAQHGPTLAVGSTDALFAALAQFITVWPAVEVDLALLTSRGPGAAADKTTAGAVAAFATMATAIANAWPANAIVPPAKAFMELALAADTVPGTYGYTLIRPYDGNLVLTTLSVVADAANPATLWPELAVDDGSSAGMQPLVLQSSTPSQATYAYPAGIAKGQSLQYRATLPKLDVVMIPDFQLSASIARNADLVAGTTTCPLFVYRTPYTGFPSPLIPLLLDDTDFDIGGGALSGLEAALQSFLTALLQRATAPAGSERPLRVAASYGYELAYAMAGATATAVRGRKSALLEADTGLVPTLPIALVPSIELTINGDDNATIDAFANNLAAFVTQWDSVVTPVHAGGALFFDVSLFSANAGSNDKPLLIARSVRYTLQA
jgi:hypothetical protein